MTNLRSPIQLGNSDLHVSRIGFGCWPIAGVSTLNTTRAESVATLQAAQDCGINFFDTAYSYGYHGEADKLLAEAFPSWPSDIILASKVGMHFDASKQRVTDGRPETLIAHTHQILERLNRAYVDVLYLHLPDPKVPIAESAAAIVELVGSGLARFAGVSNVDAEQLAEFHAVCPVCVVQPPFNMLQQDAVSQLRAVCAGQGIGIAAYWVLMKGLLAGHMQREHQLEPNDRRRTYEVYQGEAWHRAQDLLDVLRTLAKELGCTVAQVVIAWTLSQAGISVALCGARRPQQIRETAAAMDVELDAAGLSQIDVAIGRVATGGNA